MKLEENISIITVVGRHGENTVFQEDALNIKAVIAESFDPAYRLKLLERSILPLQFKFRMNPSSLQLEDGDILDIISLNRLVKPKADILCRITHHQGDSTEVIFSLQLETIAELERFSLDKVQRFLFHASFKPHRVAINRAATK